MSQTQSIEQLKERANQKVKQGVYRDALQLYTRALDSATGDTSKELQRQILSNRAQTYLSWGDIYTALADTERALSADYTQADFDKDLTAKCHFRRAKLLNIFCRYEEARDELEELRKIRAEQGQAVDDVVRELLQDVEKALMAPAGSKARQKADLLRAVDSRGIIVEHRYRTNFPYPGEPQPNADLESLEVMHFATLNERADPTNPLATPLEAPFRIVASYFRDPISRRPLNMDLSIAENAPERTLGAHVYSLFDAHALGLAMRGMPETVLRDARRQAVLHREDNAVMLLITQKGRLLVIPPQTGVRQLWAGARRPRVGSGAPQFKDLRTLPVPRPHEVDGASLLTGWNVVIHVVPKDRVRDFVAQNEAVSAMLAQTHEDD